MSTKTRKQDRYAGSAAILQAIPHARALWQIDNGTFTLEALQVNGEVVIVQNFQDGHGWQAYLMQREPKVQEAIAEIATLGQPPAKRTAWAAYAGTAVGSEISLHATRREALDAVVDALGIHDPAEDDDHFREDGDDAERDPDERPLADLDDDELDDRIQAYTDSCADDYEVQEVDLP